MSDIESLVKMLKNDDPHVRYDACEKLSAMQTLPPEAIDALYPLTIDDNQDVADAAQRALALHTEIKKVPDSLEHPEKIETFKQRDKGLVTAIGIGLFIGFICTPFLANLWLWRMSIMGSLSYGLIGGVFGIIGSVTGYTKTKSTLGALVGAIIGAMIIPSLCYFGFSSGILAF